MRVACVGDSITHGVGLQANETYPAQLQRRLRADGRADAEVLNFGLNGASLATTVERQCEFEHCEYTHTPLYAAMLRSKPDVAVILLGTNDVLFNPITAPPGNLGMAHRGAAGGAARASCRRTPPSCRPRTGWGATRTG